MLACPAGLRMPTARLRRMAMTWGPLPARIWEASSRGDVTDVVESFDAPVAAAPGGDLGGGGLVGGQAGDGVAGLGRPRRRDSRVTPKTVTPRNRNPSPSRPLRPPSGALIMLKSIALDRTGPVSLKLILCDKEGDGAGGPCKPLGHAGKARS